MGRGTAQEQRQNVRTWAVLLLVLPLIGALVACGASTGHSGLVEANQLRELSGHKLKAEQPRQFELFGHSIGVTEELIAVGALGGADPDSSGGSIRLFQPAGDEWSQEAVFSPDGAAAERFGHAVAASNGRVAVGAPYAGDSGDRAGAVYVYGENPDGWSLEQRIQADMPLAGEYFGNSVAIAGDTLAVGASGPSGQAVYVFEWNGQWVQVARLVAEVPSDTGRFGSLIALDGETLAVSEWTDSGTEPGRVHLFHNTGGAWVQLQVIEADRTGDGFGRAIDLVGQLLVVSSPYHPDSARAHVYEQVGTQWRAEAELLPSAGTGDGFAASVAIIDGAIAVASQGNGSGAGEGRVEVFRREGDKWTSTLLIEPGPAAGEPPVDLSFGTVLAAGGGLLVVGASGDSEGGQSSGAAYAYRISRGGSSE